MTTPGGMLLLSTVPGSSVAPSPIVIAPNTVTQSGPIHTLRLISGRPMVGMVHAHGNPYGQSRFPAPAFLAPKNDIALVGKTNAALNFAVLGEEYRSWVLSFINVNFSSPARELPEYAKAIQKPATILTFQI